MSLHPNCFSEATSAGGTNVLGSNLGPIIGSYIIIRLPPGRTDEICYKLTGRDGSDPIRSTVKRMSAPPLTFCPVRTWTVGLSPLETSSSVRDPNLIIPIRCPLVSDVPSAAVQMIRRAIKPTICLTTAIGLPEVSPSRIVLDSFWLDAWL